MQSSQSPLKQLERGLTITKPTDGRKEEASEGEIEDIDEQV